MGFTRIAVFSMRLIWSSRLLWAAAVMAVLVSKDRLARSYSSMSMSISVLLFWLPPLFSLMIFYFFT